MQVDSRFLPVALHAALGDTPHPGDFGEREAAEELQIDDLRERRIDLGELVERFAEAGKRSIVDDIFGSRGERRDFELGPALERMATPREVDDEAAHDARG